MLLGVVCDSSHLGFCEISGANCRYTKATMMYVQHNVSCFGFGLFEEFLQYMHHELHGGVIVVVKNDTVLLGALGLAFLFHREVAVPFSIW